MRHYEIIFLVHFDQDDQISAMIERYQAIIKSDDGKIHRLEDWGVRKLAYPVAQSYKAHYMLLNIECTQKALDEIYDAFRFNDAVIRHMVIKRDRAITKASPVLEAKNKENSKENSEVAKSNATESA